MSQQTAFESLLTQGAGTLDYWAGFSFSYPDEIIPFIKGIVITQRWIGDFKNRAVTANLPVMLDNGAYPAWRDGIELTAHQQVQTMSDAVSTLGNRIDWLIAPDIVGKGQESLQRSTETMPDMKTLAQLCDANIMLPVQEDMDIPAAIKLANQWGAGIFIGGATFKWKRAAARLIRSADRKIFIHTARIHKDGDLWHHSQLAQSFDNTTYVQALEYNRKLPVSTLARRYINKQQ